MGCVYFVLLFPQHLLTVEGTIYEYFLFLCQLIIHRYVSILFCHWSTYPPITFTLVKPVERILLSNIFVFCDIDSIWRWVLPASWNSLCIAFKIVPVNSYLRHSSIHVLSFLFPLLYINSLGWHLRLLFFPTFILTFTFYFIPTVIDSFLNIS